MITEAQKLLIGQKLRNCARCNSSIIGQYIRYLTCSNSLNTRYIHAHTDCSLLRVWQALASFLGLAHPTFHCSVCVDNNTQKQNKKQGRPGNEASKVYEQHVKTNCMQIA